MVQHSSAQRQDGIDSDSLERLPAYEQNANGELEDSVHLASLAEKKRRWWRNAFINCLLIGSWYVSDLTRKVELKVELRFALPLCPSHRYFFATILSVYNKWMFSPDRFGFPFPLFVTMMHMYVQFALAASLRALWPRRFRAEHIPSRRDYA